MGGDFYLLWGTAHQLISRNRRCRMSEDEFYEKYGGPPSRLSLLLNRFFTLIRSVFFRGKGA